MVAPAVGSPPAEGTPWVSCPAEGASETLCTVYAKSGAQEVWVRAANGDVTSMWLVLTVMPKKGACDDAAMAAKVCELGDTGPGGGTVFYDAGSRQPWGQFLEVAPAGWNGAGVNDPTPEACPTARGQGNAYGIGSGAANTDDLVELCGPQSAAALARSYNGGGKNDWSLPAFDELIALYDYPYRSAIGGFDGELDYLSSSIGSMDARVTCYKGSYCGVDYINFRSGEQVPSNNGHFREPKRGKDSGAVRPVRAF